MTSGVQDRIRIFTSRTFGAYIVAAELQLLLPSVICYDDGDSASQLRVCKISELA